MSASRIGSTQYTLRLAGHLDERWSAWFDGMAISHHPDGTSTLRGWVADQAALHGILASVRDVGATLLSLHVTDPVAAERGQR